MAELVLEHLDKVFPNGVQAVTDLCLRVNSGEFVVLAGPSGCGKTTTLRLIAGLEQPTRGQVCLGGRVVNPLPPRVRDVALVFQRPALFPHWTVRRNLAAALLLRQPNNPVYRLLLRSLYRRGWADVQAQERLLRERVAETARQLGLEHLLDRYPRQLSGGEQQRVALGRAPVRRPAVFLLDEPLSHVDAPQRADLRRELHLLHRRFPATMIYVTHDQIEAMTLADRLVLLDRGRLQQVDSPAVLYERPRNRFVARFLGWPSINLLDGCLVQEKNQLSFRIAGWSFPVPPEIEGAWSGFAGQSVTLGIRPEDVRPGKSKCTGPRAVMEVVLIESLGRAYAVTLRRPSCHLTALWADHPGAVAEQTVEIALNLRRAHLFDGASGLALYNSRSAGIDGKEEG